MKKSLIINMFAAYLSALGIGISMGFMNVPLITVFTVVFIGNMVWFIKITKEIEDERWEEERKISKMLNDNEKEFQNVYKAIALKQDKFDRKKIKPGRRPSEAYERMVKLYDGRTEDQAAPTVQAGMVEGRSDDSAREKEL